MKEKFFKVLEAASDAVTTFCGDIRFVILHLFWWFGWIAYGVEKFPYGLLTLVVSLESIVLSTFILMSQNRTEKRDRETATEDLRYDEETNKLVKQIQKDFKSFYKNYKKHE